MRKFLRKTHKFLAIPAGLIIVITCLTGAILVFQDELLQLAYPSRYFINDEQANSQRLSIQDIADKANTQLEDNTVSSVTIYADDSRTYRLGLANGFRVSAFADPHVGEVTGIHKTQESFFFKVMTLHRWLMDGSRTWGKYTIGISTLLFTIILISGFFIWMPRQWGKSRFKIQYNKGKKRLMKDLHDVLGMYACLVLLICALTGMMWSFEWYRNGVFSLFGAEVANTSGGGHGAARGGGGGRGQGKSSEPKTINMSAWQGVYETVKQENPDFEYIQIGKGTATVHSKKAFLSRNSDSYAFDNETGEITKRMLFQDQEKTARVWAWVYSLHVGDYWGIWSKIFTCLFALVGASLPITGYYLYFQKSKARRKRKK